MIRSLRNVLKSFQEIGKSITSMNGRNPKMCSRRSFTISYIIICLITQWKVSMKLRCLSYLKQWWISDVWSSQGHQWSQELNKLLVESTNPMNLKSKQLSIYKWAVIWSRHICPMDHMRKSTSFMPILDRDISGECSSMLLKTLHSM